jgi:ABC-type multidrug transport system ATPase subunit
MRKTVIRTKDLTKIYNQKILANDKINLEVFEGEIFGLLGPNGAGKTTFVKQILGLLIPTSGEIEVLGIDVIKEPEEIKKVVNYLGQNPYALWHLKTEEAIFYTSYLKGTPYKEAKKITENLIKDLGLSEYKNKLLGALSGGILRLVNFAMAISSPCKILVLDEPTAGLDPINKKIVWQKIFELNRDKNITVLLVTHDVIEAEKTLQRVAFINKSKIIKEGTPGDLKREIDERLRIELLIKPEVKISEEQKEVLKSLGELIEVRQNNLIVLPHKKELSKSVEKIIEGLTFSVIDDIKLTTPSLEDVYIKLVGEKII